jgi:hypothetical protein
LSEEEDNEAGNTDPSKKVLYLELVFAYTLLEKEEES